jgi:hypothetical protein
MNDPIIFKYNRPFISIRTPVPALNYPFRLKMKIRHHIPADKSFTTGH